MRAVRLAASSLVMSGRPRARQSARGRGGSWSGLPSYSRVSGDPLRVLHVLPGVWVPEGDAHQARLDQVQSVEKPEDLGVAAQLERRGVPGVQFLRGSDLREIPVV